MKYGCISFAANIVYALLLFLIYYLLSILLGASAPLWYTRQDCRRIAAAFAPKGASG